MIIYIAGPFAADTRRGVEENVAHLHAKGLELMEEGHTVILPVWLGDHIPYKDLTDPKKRQYWEDLIVGNDERIIQMCNVDTLYLCKGWANSRGANREVLMAQKLDLHIMFEEDGE